MRSSSSPPGSFREIEHKFVVEEGDFDPATFRETIQALNPERIVRQRVRDRYFLLHKDPGFIYRHRYDEELQHLTVKTLGGDTEDRLEVNLDLGQHQGDQGEAVERFLAVRGIGWQGTIHKQIEVYYLPDCEAVYYKAHTDEAGAPTVRCVEFESIGQETLEAARGVLRRYEALTGFDGARRERRSLVEILFGEKISGEIPPWSPQSP